MTDPPDDPHRERSGGPPGPRPARCRRFNLGDAMILVAATALGFAWAPPYLYKVWANVAGVTVGQWVGASPWSASVGRKDGAIYLMVSAMAVLWTITNALKVAYLLVRLRKPRPSLRELAFQPGVVVCEALMIAFVGCWVRFALRWPPPDVWEVIYQGMVPAAWAALAMLGLWRPEPGWIERLGFTLGICWTAHGMLVLTQLVLMRRGLW
jgi:hypothetical protein